MIEIFILSFIQGVTEFIPVSSSSHLILMSDLLDFENQSLSIDVSLHIGSLFAVLVYFYRDIINFIENKNLFLKIFISSLPVMIVGFLLVETGVIDQIRNIKIIAWTTLIFGFLLYFSDKFKLEKKLDKNFNHSKKLKLKVVFLLAIANAYQVCKKRH